ncbi:transcription termination/antitermination protein NusG [Spiroplasma sp. AdecLV25b]|uniref:transcription termination/antitermination protein NusG n=1 Tax=Spiroplasma sp. AdecLV25b TaxID=3027162 RepID=UPI0027E016A3|nr:transcription termination/antitermination protein NusG [Spiroplasma sp. AdecLV25b]
MKNEKLLNKVVPVEETHKNRIAQAQWYIVNCNKGNEDKVAAGLRQKIEKKLNLKDNIFQVRVVSETSTDKDKKVTEKNIFPGYIFVHMILTEDTWYDIRNTAGINGFIGSSGKGVPPTPLSTKEVNEMLYRNSKPPVQPKVKQVKEVNRDFKVDDFVHITSGALQDREGRVTKVDDEKGVATVAVDMFGRETEVKVEYDSCKKINS